MVTREAVPRATFPIKMRSSAGTATGPITRVTTQPYTLQWRAGGGRAAALLRGDLNTGGTPSHLTCSDLHGMPECTRHACSAPAPQLPSRVPSPRHPHRRSEHHAVEKRFGTVNFTRMAATLLSLPVGTAQTKMTKVGESRRKGSARCEGVWEGGGRACERRLDVEDGSDGCSSEGAASTVSSTRYGPPLASASRRHKS